VKTAADFHVDFVATCGVANAQEFGFRCREHEGGITAVDWFLAGETDTLPG
jgi:hypothetical protein